MTELNAQVAAPAALSVNDNNLEGIALTDMQPSTELATIDTSTEVATQPEKKVKRIVRKKRRPARPQVDPATFKTEPPPQTGTTFNIWYNKWSGGDREDKYLSKTHAAGRCNIAADSGYTRADRVNGSYFCLFFARGLCPKGQDCEYLHRLPTLHDIFPSNVDCFGRDKHADYRDDMGGVGSFMRMNRTIYVGRIFVSGDIEEVVARHFQEWGQIDRTRVLNTRGVAFVTYTNEANAQFAKEAMAHQSLDNNEVLNVRWATADPNPQAQKREARKIEEQAAEAIRRALPADFLREIEGDDNARKRRKVQGGFGLEGYDAPDDVWYKAEKARVEGANGADTAVLEASDEMLLLEATGSEQREDGKEDGEEDLKRSAGLLPASTLAALKSYSSTPALAFSRSTAGTAGPLVDYGSDEDSE